MAFGSIFGRLGIWMRLGRIWAFKIKAFASHGHFLNTLGVPCCLTLRYKNPRAASLRLAERHNCNFLRKFFKKLRPLIKKAALGKVSVPAGIQTHPKTKSMGSQSSARGQKPKKNAAVANARNTSCSQYACAETKQG